MEQKLNVGYKSFVVWVKKLFGKINKSVSNVKKNNTVANFLTNGPIEIVHTYAVIIVLYI